MWQMWQSSIPAIIHPPSACPIHYVRCELHTLAHSCAYAKK